MRSSIQRLRWRPWIDSTNAYMVVGRAQTLNLYTTISNFIITTMTVSLDYISVFVTVTQVKSTKRIVSHYCSFFHRKWHTYREIICVGGEDKMKHFFVIILKIIVEAVSVAEFQTKKKLSSKISLISLQHWAVVVFVVVHNQYHCFNNFYADVFFCHIVNTKTQ